MKNPFKKKKITLEVDIVELRHLLFELFSANPSQDYNLKQAAMRVELGEKSYRQTIEAILEDMVQQGVIELIDKGKYRLTRRQMPKITGRVDMTSSGMAFIVVDGAGPADKDIVVEERNLHHAMHDDKVEVAIIGRRRDGRKEGEVLQILEQKKRTFVGRIEVSEKFAFVIVDSRRVPCDIFVPMRATGGAQNGQKVIVKVTEWPETSKNPLGEVIDVLGNVGDNNTEMHAILAEYDLPYSFPEELEEQAAKIKDKILKSEIKRRRDMRGVTTFTIDPADAKDFDDALSLRKLDNGYWEVGVHIADVTHYVQPGDAIDKEAIERATSVYLVDRTIPMLPEKLSNFLCSLRPNEEKLCFSAIFELDDQAKMVDEWFGRTVICSDRRYAYEDAQKIIEADQGSDEIEQATLTLHKLAQQLRADRFAHGSIGFERDEAKFILDETGKPTGVYFKEQKESNQLIEEFMLLANRKVAEFVGKKKAGQKAKTFIYRVHDTPNEEKFEKFKGFISRFGFFIKAERGKAVAKELTKVLQKVKGTPEENLISTLAIRSMAKATYTTENIGHYGLAFDYYTHFTSPIRRYPDMMVHRLLQQYLDGGKSAPRDEYEQLCEHSSAMEIRAAEAERASIKYKMVEYMIDRVGSEFDGVISGVTEWGIYVELEDTKIEGMVALRDMADDFYSFDGETYAAVGQKSGRRFTLGDVVRIRIKRADLQRKQLDFEMMGMIDFRTRAFTALPEADLSLKAPSHYERRRPQAGGGKGRQRRR